MRQASLSCVKVSSPNSLEGLESSLSSGLLPETGNEYFWRPVTQDRQDVAPRSIRIEETFDPDIFGPDTAKDSECTKMQKKGQRIKVNFVYSDSLHKKIRLYSRVLIKGGST